MSKSAAKTVNKTVNKDVNKDVENIFYYNRKIETYKDRIKWLRKQILAINQKIKIYTECREDFYNSILSKARKKSAATVNKEENKEENTEANTTEENKK